MSRRLSTICYMLIVKGQNLRFLLSLSKLEALTDSQLGSRIATGIGLEGATSENRLRIDKCLPLYYHMYKFRLLNISSQNVIYFESRQIR